ncbi:MAG: MotA/TolQ/ExbB proton channel family protein [Lysobacterales bacterium]
MIFDSFIAEIMTYVEKGGYVMPPLIVATVVLWLAIGYRISLLKRGSQRSVRVLLERTRGGKLRRAKGLIDRAVLTGVGVLDSHPVNHPDGARPYLDVAFSPFEQDLVKYGALITSIISIAPLLGLLGTVVGMIETFDSLGDMSLFSQSGGIAGGISQALFTTQMGLAVAIPGLLVKGFLDRQQNRLELELAQIKDLLTSQKA